MECPNESTLVEFADRLLPSELRETVARHIDGCELCRVLVATLVRDSSTAPPTTSEAIGDVLPADLLGVYLRKDARQREMTASLLVGSIASVGAMMTSVFVVFGRNPLAWRALVVLVAVAAYEIVLHIRLRGGYWHRSIPFVSTTVEVSFSYLINQFAFLHMGADALTNPWRTMTSGIILLSAFRTDARISIGAGLLAGAHEIALYIRVRTLLGPLGPDALVAVRPIGAFIRVGACVFSGIAAAMLARHFVRRATEALHEIRSQDLFGKYLLSSRIGVGGMGEVFRASYCPEGGFVRTVAVKRLRPDLSSDKRLVDSLRKEARTAARLTHPNLVQVFDCGQYRGAFVLAMELVDGLSLSALLRAHGSLPPTAVAHVGVELASALAYLHARRGEDGAPLGLVHCDLNPPNILLSRIGEVKLADLGAARATQLDPAHGFAGKERYAAPEQLRGEPFDGRADLYGLGVTLREALGQQPVPADFSTLLEELTAPGRHARPADADVVRQRLLALEGERREGEALLVSAIGHAVEGRAIFS
jgi:serine/threonine-protein kinase